MFKYRGTVGFMPLDEFNQPWKKYKRMISSNSVIVDATGVTFACNGVENDTCKKLRKFLTNALEEKNDLELHFVIRCSEAYNRKDPLAFTGGVTGKYMSASTIQAVSPFQMICSFIETIPPKKESRRYVHVVGLPKTRYTRASKWIPKNIKEDENIRKYLHLLDEVDDAYISYLVMDLDVQPIDFSAAEAVLTTTTPVVLSKDRKLLDADKRLWYSSPADNHLKGLHELISAEKYVICFKESKCIYDVKKKGGGTEYRVINMPCVVDVSSNWFRVG